MKKILFVLGSLNQGGAELQILQLAKLFRDKGHKVEIFALTDYDFYLPYIKEHKLKYSHLKNDQSKIWRVWLTAKKIRYFKPDLVISYLKLMGQTTLLARALSGVKTKVVIGERTSNIRPYHDFFYFNLLRLADLVTVNSYPKLEYLQKKFPWLRRKLKFFPNVIDMESCNFRIHPVRGAVRRLTFVGRLSPEKNVINLILAVKALQKQGQPIELKIYGDTRAPAYFNEIKKAVGENDRIKIMGKTSNVSKVYENTDLLCLLSDYEGLSNVLAEAIAHGTPILSSRIPENSLLVEDGVNGFLVNQNDLKDIQQGIRNYFTLSKDQEEKMRKASREKAEEIFNSDKLYNEYIQRIDKL